MTYQQIDGGRQIRDFSIPVNKLVGGVLTYERATASFTTTTLDVGDTGTGTIQLATGFRLIHIECDHEARIRLYSTPDKRTADAARPVGTDPEEDHGLIVEYVTTATCLAADLSPTVDGYSMESPLSNDIAIAVEKLDTGTTTVTVTFVYVVTED